MGKIISLNLSEHKGTSKQPAAEIELLPGLGVKHDAHAAPGDRQVSLLMAEHVEAARERLEAPAGCKVKGVKLVPGVFGENITTRGIDLLSLEIGDELAAGRTVRLRISRIGKECQKPCAIYYRTGECIMPEKGIFAEVLEGGPLRPGDKIEKR